MGLTMTAVITWNESVLRRDGFPGATMRMDGSVGKRDCGERFYASEVLELRWHERRLVSMTVLRGESSMTYDEDGR